MAQFDKRARATQCMKKNEKSFKKQQILCIAHKHTEKGTEFSYFYFPIIKEATI